MPTPVVMPQMGESIAEGTIVRWMKKIGEAVDQDEPLFEISTDKVDAEIPSPAAGVLTEIKVREGETVAVNSVVATIGQAGDVTAASSEPQGDGGSEAGAGTTPAGAGELTPSSDVTAAGSDLRRQKSSPLVRRIARDRHVDLTRIHGSGVGGRVTKRDILGFLGESDGGAAPSGPSGVSAPPVGSTGHGSGVDVEPLSVMRRKIAEHMVLSRRTSAHVHTVFHVNFSLVDRIRQQKKAEYERAGAKLTYMSFIATAVIDALRRHRIVNASLDANNVVYKKDINLGIAVALPSGLIVPVIKRADEKNMLGLSRAIAEIADRARTKQLNPDEVHGGTFTITNPGQFGAQFGMPIINQPQVAILGVGTIEKRAVVVDDAIGIRTMAYLTLGFDHRLIDGAVADEFMADIKNHLEQFDPSRV